MKTTLLLVSFFFGINTILAQPPAIMLRDSLNLTSALYSSDSVDYNNPIEIGSLKNSRAKYYELEEDVPPNVICWSNYVPYLMKKFFEITFSYSDETHWANFRVKDSCSFSPTVGYLLGADVDSTGVVYKANIITLINDVNDMEYNFVKLSIKLYDYPEYNLLDDGITLEFVRCIDVFEERYLKVRRVFY